jgi:hypothetical protein
MSSRRFKIASSKIIHQNFDGEIVIVNLDTGSYYNLVHAGAVMWEWLMQGATVEQFVEWLALKSAGNRASIESAVHDLLEAMQTENLIAPSNAVPASSANPPLDHMPPPLNLNMDLQKYSDMQDLLLLDPIHEVDEAGWPVAKKE